MTLHAELALVSSAAAHELEDGEEDVDGVEVDGEGEGDGGLAVAASADAGEVANGEKAEDAEGEPGVGIRREEVEEHAGNAGDHEDEQRGETDAGDAAVVDVEEVGDAAHDGHAGSCGGCGVEDKGGAEGLDVPVDEGTDLPAHEVGEGEEESEREVGAGTAAGGVDGEDEADDGDEADEGAACRGGGDAERGDEESQRGDGENLGQERGGLFAGCVDDGGVGVGAVLVHCLLRLLAFRPGGAWFSEYRLHGQVNFKTRFDVAHNLIYMRRMVGWLVMLDGLGAGQDAEVGPGMRGKHILVGTAARQRLRGGL